MPIIDLAKGLKASAVVELWADDPAVAADLAAFCSATGHRTERQEIGPAHLFRAVVRRRT